MPNGNVGIFRRAQDETRTFTEFAEQYNSVDISPQALRRIYEEQKLDKLYLSDFYQVAINKNPRHGFPGMKVWWLSIKRLDKEPIMDWRDLQAIKTQLCGSEVEAVQIFPSESRVVDTSNQYHLWAFMSKERNGIAPRFPLGWQSRQVSENKPDQPNYVGGAKQRPLT